MKALKKLTWTLVVLGLMCGCQSSDPSSPSDSQEELTEKESPLTLRAMTPTQFRFAVRDLFHLDQTFELFIPSESAQLGGLQGVEVNHFDNAIAVSNPTSEKIEVLRRFSGAVAEHVAGDPDRYTDCGTDPTSTCLQDSALALAQTAWKRALTPDETEAVTTLFSEVDSTHGSQEAFAATLEFMLLSPDFLYVPEIPESVPSLRRGTEMAALMATLLWGSIPDEELMEAALSGELETREQIEAHAWRMLSDWRAQRGLNEFYRQFLELDAIGAGSVDLETYLLGLKTTEVLTETEVSASHLHTKLHPVMRMEPEVSINETLFDGGSSTLSELLTRSTTWGSAETSALYGGSMVEGATALFWVYEPLAILFPMMKIQLDETQRSGLLTSLGFLSSNANTEHPSPIKRGVFILERFLCRELGSPPPMIPALEEVGTPGGPKTNRERVENQTSAPACASCHEHIDGIGFTFENYDSLGAWRETDNGHPVDASGQVMLDGTVHEVQNAVELMAVFSESREIHDCHVIQWLRYAMGRELKPTEEQELQGLQEGFWESGGDIRELLVNITLTHLFRLKEEGR